MCLAFELTQGCPLHQPNTNLYPFADWAHSASAYVATCLLTEKRSGRKIDGGVVSKCEKIVGLMCQDTR